MAKRSGSFGGGNQGGGKPSNLPGKNPRNPSGKSRGNAPSKDKKK